MSEKINIIISVFNESKVLNHLQKELEGLFRTNEKYKWSVIFVDDGSEDNSVEIIKNIIKEKNKFHEVNYTLIELSRNFGHEAAMIAGIDHADGDIVICLDADLQHPPNLIPEMINKIESGFDIVTMIRKYREDNGIIKNLMSKQFYHFLNLISDYKFEEGASDFFAISKKVANVLKHNYRERNRFLRGFIQIIGFDKASIEYVAPKRIAGESKYSLKQLVRLAEIAIFSFSKKPLYFSLFIALFSVLFTIILSIYSLYMYFFGERPPSGYTTIVLFLSYGFSALFILIAIISMYLGKIMDETKERPVYLIKNKYE
jgi:dolichol-phosphate mannosyltransferase